MKFATTLPIVTNGDAARSGTGGKKYGVGQTIQRYGTSFKHQCAVQRCVLIESTYLRRLLPGQRQGSLPAISVSAPSMDPWTRNCSGAVEYNRWTTRQTVRRHEPTRTKMTRPWTIARGVRQENRGGHRRVKITVIAPTQVMRTLFLFPVLNSTRLASTCPGRTTRFWALVTTVYSICPKKPPEATQIAGLHKTLPMCGMQVTHTLFTNTVFRFSYPFADCNRKLEAGTRRRPSTVVLRLLSFITDSTHSRSSAVERFSLDRKISIFLRLTSHWRWPTRTSSQDRTSPARGRRSSSYRRVQAPLRGAPFVAQAWHRPSRTSTWQQWTWIQKSKQNNERGEQVLSPCTLNSNFSFKHQFVYSLTVSGKQQPRYKLPFLCCFWSVIFIKDVQDKQACIPNAPNCSIGNFRTDVYKQVDVVWDATDFLISRSVNKRPKLATTDVFRVHSITQHELCGDPPPSADGNTQSPVLSTGTVEYLVVARQQER